MSVLLTAHQSGSHEFFRLPPSQNSSLSVEALMSHKTAFKKRIPLLNRRRKRCQTAPEIIVIDDNSSPCNSPGSGTTWDSSSDELDKVEPARSSCQFEETSSAACTTLGEKIKLELELETLWCDFEEVQDEKGSNMVHRDLPCCFNSTLERCIGHYNLMHSNEPYVGVSFEVPFGPEYVRKNYEKLVRSPDALDNTETLTALNFRHMKALGEAITRVKSNYNKNSFISLKPLAYSYSSTDSESESSNNQHEVLYSERIPDPSTSANDSLHDATNRNRSQSSEFLSPPPVLTLAESQSRNKRKDFQSNRMYEFQACKRLKPGLYKSKEQQPPRLKVIPSTLSGSAGKLKPHPPLPKSVPVKCSQFDWLDSYFKK